MDSQETNFPLEEKALDPKEVSTEEAAEQLTTTIVETEVAEEETLTNVYTNKETIEEIIGRLEEIINSEEKTNKQELDALKQNFYKLLKNKQEEAKEAFVEAGGNVDEFTPQHDTQEDEYKALMAQIKERRQQQLQQEEALREENLQRKQAIVERLKVLSEGNLEDNAYNEVKQLQQEWKEIGEIPATRMGELWKNYQLYMEKFYDLMKLNNEFREYDFKKNLEIKNRLCEEAEKLIEEKDVIEAFRKLQKLHVEYKETGPVAKELREALWLRFKTASGEINRKHQAFYEARKEVEQQNYDQKVAICEIIEAIDYESLQTAKGWEEQTKEVLALQAKWKTIGYAPQKINVKVFERFRAACDVFFNRKASYFKQYREDQTQNLEKKRILCEKAEALKESTDWKATADTLSRLQKEWKSIGHTAYKQSEELWKRFIAACDYFFEQKGKATSSQRTEEMGNLEKKREIINQLAAIGMENAEEAGKKVRALVQEWNSTGHVPFKEKDKIFKEYRSLVDNLFEQLNLSASQKRLNNFRSNLGTSGNSLPRERERLVRAYENMKNEIQTYENNIGFLNSSSKKGNSLVNEMNRKVEKLKSELQLIVEKIKVIDEQTDEA